ncbi:hypothetical protein [Microvirga lotononidis]|nr:hypothetical protein [Microvirga lotononidis]WQO31731.1 hypothetical protein U0023_30680 [Microvirga lotononidis]
MSDVSSGLSSGLGDVFAMTMLLAVQAGAHVSLCHQRLWYRTGW